MPLFWFPHVVNDYAARAIAAQVVVVSCFGIGFRERDSMQWAIFALAIDFCLRFVWGPNVSPLGAIAQMLVHFLPRKWSVGPPKQFATLCGVCFAGLACALLLGIDGYGGEVAGSVVLGMLIGAAALEACLGLCVGCIMFSQVFVRFGLVDREVVDKCDRIIAETAAYSDHVEGRRELFKQSARTVPAGGPDAGPSPIDYHYTLSSDDHRLRDYNPAKHLDFGDLAMVLGVAGLALVLKQGVGVDDLNFPEPLWVTVAIIAAVLFSLWLLLGMLKCAAYPRRVVKLWHHPVDGSAVGMLPLSFLVFAALAIDDEYGLAEVLFWIGAPLSVLVASFSTARLFALRHHHYPWLHPLMLINFVGPMVAAYLAPSVRTASRDSMLLAGWFFWSLPFLMFVVIKAALFLRMGYSHDLDDRMKPAYAVVMACSAVATVAYVELNGGVWDNFALFCYFVTVCEALVLLCLLAYNYLGAHAFSRSVWGLTFPLHLGSLASISFYRLVSHGDAAQFILYCFVIASCYATVQCGLMTCLLNLRLRYFIGHYKWGPNSINLITHRAFEGAAAELVRIAARLAPDNAKACDDFARLFDDFAFVHHHHAEQEDAVVFPSLDGLFPAAGIVAEPGHEHERDREIMETLLGHCASLRGPNPSAAACQAVRDALPGLVDNLNGHIATEEVHLQPLLRKYGNFAWFHDLTRRQFFHTSMQHWARIVPFVIRWAPFDEYRRRFLQACQLFIPEYMERIGIWLHLSCPPEIVERLRDTIPAIHPRGLIPGGWQRYN